MQFCSVQVCCCNAQTSLKHGSFATWGNICLSSFLIIFNAQLKPSSDDFACFRVCFPSGIWSSKILWILGNRQKLDLSILAAAVRWYLWAAHKFKLLWNNCSKFLPKKKVKITSERLKKKGCHAKKVLFYVSYERPVANSNSDRQSGWVTAASQVSMKACLQAQMNHFPTTLW